MKKINSILVKFFTIVLFVPMISNASVKQEGYFIAQKSCEAVHSIKKGTLPYTITKGIAYKVTAKNKPDATHYSIVIEELENNPNRWVPIQCGVLLTECAIIRPEPDQNKTEGKSYVLAISWQPAFCQTHQNKKECQTQTEDRYDATHFALHGLWPQPRNNTYCNVSDNDKGIDRNKQWYLLDPLGLSDETFDELSITMPGTASFLHRHEWIKHGTCYSNSAEVYYQDSIKLINKINDTTADELFANNINNIIFTEHIREEFDKAFGEGTGKKVEVQCDNKGLIVELRINLTGDISSDVNLSKLLKDAPNAKNSCSSGKVDAVGF